MSRPRSLPRHRTEAWLSGFAVEHTVYTASISVNGSIVVDPPLTPIVPGRQAE